MKNETKMKSKTKKEKAKALYDLFQKSNAGAILRDFLNHKLPYKTTVEDHRMGTKITPQKERMIRSQIRKNFKWAVEQMVKLKLMDTLDETKKDEKKTTKKSVIKDDKLRDALHAIFRDSQAISILHHFINMETPPQFMPSWYKPEAKITPKEKETLHSQRLKDFKWAVEQIVKLMPEEVFDKMGGKSSLVKEVEKVISEDKKKIKVR